MEKEAYRLNLELLNEVYPLPRVLLSLQEAAEICGVKASRLVETKGFPATKVGGRWRVSKGDLARWMSH